MFGLFKKKPSEVKYGRDNYVDYSSFEVNERSWMLLLGSVFVEAIDLEIGSKKARHDLLEIYEEGALDEDEKDELDNFFTLEGVSQIKKRINEIRELEPWNFEDDLYYIVNAPTKEAVKAMAESRHEDDEERKELYEVIWKKKEEYEHTHLRTGLIVEAMVQVRLAYYFGKLREEVAWSYLEELMQLLRPLLTLFASWEAFNKNIEQFNEIRNYEFYFYSLGHQKNIMNAVVCLNLREESVLRLIPFEYGIDRDYKYNITSHTNILPTLIPSTSTLKIVLEELIERDDKTEFWKYLENLEGEEYDTQTAYFLSNTSKYLNEEELLELPELYPNAYAYAMRADFFFDFAWEARGEGVSSTVGEENYNLFFERLSIAEKDLKIAHELLPANQAIWARLYTVLSLSGEDDETREKLYNYIKKDALNNRFCVNQVSYFKQKRWGGSHEENLDWARKVTLNTEPFSKSRLIIISAHIERYDYMLCFDDDKNAINKVFKDKAIQSEVNQYFDEFLEMINTENYIFHEVLIYWYAKVEDYDRLRQVIQKTEPGMFDTDAFNEDYNEEYTEIVMNWLRSV